MTTQPIDIEPGTTLKLLLTSGGVTNTSIREALVDLLGKPIADANALCIPTAQYGHPWAGPGEKAWRFISGKSANPMVELGWMRRHGRRRSLRPAGPTVRIGPHVESGSEPHEVVDDGTARSRSGSPR
jgi:hypothetical protein